MREREISVDINGGAFKFLKYKQYDHNNLLKIIVKEGKEDVILTGYTARAFFERPDGVILEKNCTIVSNEIKLMITNDVLARKGKVSTEITLSDGNKIVTTFRMYLEVEGSIDRNSAIEEDPEWDLIKDGLRVLDTKANQSDLISLTNRVITNESDIENLENTIDVMYSSVEGSHISTDSSVGYAKDVEILGNTIQDASNLADIRSVGDKVEGQELYEIPVVSCGKNLWDSNNVQNGNYYLGNFVADNNNYATIKPIQVKPGMQYTSSNKTNEHIMRVTFYDKDMQYISLTSSKVFITPSNAKYAHLHVNISSENIQLEEGTVATPYEPYQEDKLTILSPVQLERVGDVADRIIEKDEVWGVEKNIETIIVTSGNTISKSIETANHVRFDIILPNLVDKGQLICNRLKWEHSNDDNPHCWQGASQIAIFIPKVELETYDVEGCKKWIDKQNQLIFVRATTNLQFIPLPHDQQVKLRTFANKTNISFLTEIEGTIKAQVPKSLGATVNTHTEQIGNLNKELDKIKKLEESTVSTVETESDFTTVEATSGGYFEDVKLEGKTLVNLPRRQVSYYPSGSNDAIIVSDSNVICYEYEIKPNTTYTIKKDEVSDRGTVALFSSNSVGSLATKTVISMISDGKISTIRTGNEDKYMLLYVNSTLISSGVKTTVLEGDHTQYPPSYFEGLKSVGQGTDEIVVSSVKGDGNLFDESLLSKYITSTDANEYTLDYNTMYIDNFVHPVNGDGQYTFSYTCKETVGSKNPRFTFRYDDDSIENINSATSNSFTRYSRTSNANKKLVGIKVSFSSAGGNWIIQKDSIILNKGTTSKPYTPYKSDKKRLLYYNDETQTWEKPILRQWDSIEKHSNGKYYYHQRSGEVVLNGSEDWSDFSTINGVGKAYTFAIKNKAYGFDNLVCDKLPVTSTFASDATILNGISGTNSNNAIWVSINASITDAQGFKQWLQTNNVTVVYQLAEEKVYECTNIDLITYANETNYIVESGVIVPKSTLKVLQNATNIIRQLQQKVSVLETDNNRIMQILSDIRNN